MAFRWRAYDDPTLNAGLVADILQRIRTCITRKPYIFCDFSGGSGPPAPPPPLDPHLSVQSKILYKLTPLTEKLIIETDYLPYINFNGIIRAVCYYYA